MLIVSGTEKSIDFFQEVLAQNYFQEIVIAHSCGEARRLLIDRSFDLCIINAPLSDGFGEEFARSIISTEMMQVILIVRSELFDAVSEKVEDLGIFVLSKPISRGMFWSALKLVSAAHNRILQLHSEKGELLQKIADIRIIDRAKCVLIEHLKMTEKQAHKYIEKQAMDMRVTKRVVASSILKTYER